MEPGPIPASVGGLTDGAIPYVSGGALADSQVANRSGGIKLLEDRGLEGAIYSDKGRTIIKADSTGGFGASYIMLDVDGGDNQTRFQGFQTDFGVSTTTPANRLYLYGLTNDGPKIAGKIDTRTTDLTAGSHKSFLSLSAADWAAPDGREAFRAEADGTKVTVTTAGTVKVTELGGVAVKFQNQTGAASIAGTVVALSTAADRAVEAAAAGAYNAVGVIYEGGVAVGGDVWVVVTGIARVLIDDSTAAIRNGFAVTGATAGRINASGAVPSPPTDAEHFKEIGHCMESITAGTDQLALVNLHFN